MTQPQADEMVTYRPGDGRESVEAVVTAVHEEEDGGITVDILYPHRLDELALATAERVRPGSGIFQFTVPSVEEPAAEEPGEPTPEQPVEEVATPVEEPAAEEPGEGD